MKKSFLSAGEVGPDEIGHHSSDQSSDPLRQRHQRHDLGVWCQYQVLYSSEVAAYLSTCLWLFCDSEQ